MQVSSHSNLGVPQGSTYRPGLSGQPADASGSREVLPVVGARDAATQRQEGPPAQFWRTLNGGPDPATHIAPPSIMQIKISQLLDAQAGSIDDEAKSENASKPEAANADQAPNRPTDSTDPEAGPGEEGSTAETDPSGRRSAALTAYGDAASVVSDTAQPAET